MTIDQHGDPLAVKGKPRIVLADDDAVVRSSIGAQLGYSFEVVGAGGSADEAIALAIQHKPDLVLLDVQMPGGGGLRATKEIIAQIPSTTIVILSGDEEREAVLELLSAGAVSYVRKGLPPDELIATLMQSLKANRGDSS